MGAGVNLFVERATGFLGAGGDRERDEVELLWGERDREEEDEDNLPEVLDRADLDRWRRRLADCEDFPLLLALLGEGDADLVRDLVRLEHFMAGDWVLRAGSGAGDLLFAVVADF